jgi:hypothetical protein
MQSELLGVLPMVKVSVTQIRLQFQRELVWELALVLQYSCLTLWELGLA